MIYNTFATFEEAKSAQEYDFNLFCAKKFAEVTEIDFNVIISLGLYSDQNKRHQYYTDNNIAFSDEQKLKIHDVMNYFNITDRWANIYEYNNSFIYLNYPESDISYNKLDLGIDEIRLLIPLNDDGIYLQASE